MSIASIQSQNYQDSISYARTQTRLPAESAPTQSTTDTVSFSAQARAMVEAEKGEKEQTSEEFIAENFKERNTAKTEEVPTKVTLLSMLMDALLLAQIAENEDSIAPAPADTQTTQGSNEQGNTEQTPTAQSPVKETAEAAKAKPSGMFGNSGKVSEIKQVLYRAAGGIVEISDVSKAMGSASTAPSSIGAGGTGGSGKASVKNDDVGSRLLVV